MEKSYGGLFRADRMVLVLLATRGPLSSADLQRLLDRTPGSVATSTTKLIRMRLIERCRVGYECVDNEAVLRWFRSYDPEILQLCGVRLR